MPCMCGDPYCRSCGNPRQAELEAAEEWAIDTLGKANLTPDEYRIVVKVGLAAVNQSRKVADKAVKECRAEQAMVDMMAEP